MRDAIAAAAALVVAALAAWQAAQLPFGGLHAPGPGFFPLAISVLILALSGLLLGRAVVAGRGISGAPAARDDASSGALKVALLVVALALYVLALDALGYPICTFLLVLFMLRVLEPQRWPVAVGMAVGTAAVSYVLFAVWLRVPLPPGPLGG